MRRKSPDEIPKEFLRTKVDRWGLSSKALGRGAGGEVVLGMDTESGGMVAVKKLMIAGLSGERSVKLLSEIELLKGLAHENIVQYIGSKRTQRNLYVVMGYMDKGSVADLVKKYKKLPEDLAMRIFREALHGLDYLHREGIVHRDIKGGNILCCTTGGVRLADFGVSELRVPENDSIDVAGTPYWMAPEVVEVKSACPGSDIWGLGCTLCEMLTGHPPYGKLPPYTALYRVVQDDCPPLPPFATLSIKNLLKQCFIKDVKVRPTAPMLLLDRAVYSLSVGQVDFTILEAFHETSKILNKTHGAYPTTTDVLRYIKISSKDDLARVNPIPELVKLIHSETDEDVLEESVMLLGKLWRDPSRSSAGVEYWCDDAFVSTCCAIIEKVKMSPEAQAISVSLLIDLLDGLPHWSVALRRELLFSLSSYVPIEVVYNPSWITPILDILSSSFAVSPPDYEILLERLFNAYRSCGDVWCITSLVQLIRLDPVKACLVVKDIVWCLTCKKEDNTTDPGFTLAMLPVLLEICLVVEDENLKTACFKTYIALLKDNTKPEVQEMCLMHLAAWTLSRDPYLEKNLVGELRGITEVMCQCGGYGDPFHEEVMLRHFLKLLKTDFVKEKWMLGVSEEVLSWLRQLLLGTRPSLVMLALSLLQVILDIGSIEDKKAPALYSATKKLSKSRNPEIAKPSIALLASVWPLKPKKRFAYIRFKK